jgi:hypothetical protein
VVHPGETDSLERARRSPCSNFKESGECAIPVCHIIGELIVQPSKNFLDLEIIEFIMETPMIQCFLDFDTFTKNVILDDSNL